VALANKIARIAWVILNKPGALYERVDPAHAYTADHPRVAKIKLMTKRKIDET
jgi:hypothetical protein